MSSFHYCLLVLLSRLLRIGAGMKIRMLIVSEEAVLSCPTGVLLFITVIQRTDVMNDVFVVRINTTPHSGYVVNVPPNDVSERNRNCNVRLDYTLMEVLMLNTSTGRKLEIGASHKLPICHIFLIIQSSMKIFRIGMYPRSGICRVCFIMPKISI